MRRPALLWTLAAVGGLVLVAGLTLAASRLSSQTVGLSSEPLQAGQALAPAATRTPTPTATARPKPKPKRKKPKPKPKAAATPTPRAVATATPAPVAPAPTVDDHGGSSGGHGSDDSSGDDHGSGGHGSDD